MTRLGARTIDMHIAGRLDRRGRTLAGAIDGDAGIGSEQQILLSLINDLLTSTR